MSGLRRARLRKTVLIMQRITESQENGPTSETNENRVLWYKYKKYKKYKIIITGTGRDFDINKKKKKRKSGEKERSGNLLIRFGSG